jgi:hypothetical protein
MLDDLNVGGRAEANHGLAFEDAELLDFAVVIMMAARGARVGSRDE